MGLTDLGSLGRERLNRAKLARATAAAGAALLLSALAGGVASAQDKTYVMKISAPTINAAPDQFGRVYGAMVEKDSGGRIKAEVYPASQLGPIARQIEGTQFGAIQCAVIPPEFFVGVDDRFEVLAAPGLVDTMEHGQHVAADPAVAKLMLGLGAGKGLYGAAVFMAEQNAVISRSPIRHLDDFKGKKIRVFASKFQTEAFERLGVTPVAMTLGDVLPAIQQGAIDGAIAGITIFTGMHYQDAAKYVTATEQPAIFLVAEINRNWHDSLPADLQQIVDNDAAKAVAAINSWTIDFNAKARKLWVGGGGEMITLPAAEQSAMMKTLASVGDDVSKSKPGLAAAYQVVKDAAQRTR